MGRLNGRWTVRGAAMAAALALVVPVATRAARASDAELVRDARKTLAVFQKNDPSLTKFAGRSAGYVVFPTITKGAAGVGGAYFETASAVADFEDHLGVLLAAELRPAGVAVFTATKGGLMADASVGGQKFGYEALAHPQ